MNDPRASHSAAATLLLVEDDDLDAEALALVLREAGGDSTRRLTAAEVKGELAAAASASNDLPPACLLGLKLPNEIGLDLLRWIRSDPWLDQLPVVILTALSHDDHLRLARELGAQCYLLKFPSPQQLREVLLAAELYQAEPEPRSIFPLSCNLLHEQDPGPEAA